MFDAVTEVREAEVARLEGEIAEVCGVLNAATGRLVELIAKVLATDAWTGAGIRSAEHWVAWQCGVSASRARELVALARRGPELPETTAALRAGELSHDQATVVCRYGSAHNDRELADFAREATVSQLHRTLSSYVAAPVEPVEAIDDKPEEVRRVTFGTTDTGQWRLSAILPIDEGAVVERALCCARDALFSQAEHEGAQVGWADALVAVADSMLSGQMQRRRHSDRHLVLVHLDTRQAHGSDGGGSWLHGGPGLPEPLRRYLNCDTRVRPVWETEGKPVSVGRALRTVPDRTRTLIENRDRGCRVPGCPRTRWLHIHHLIHWESGGRTDTNNLIALCAHHHRLHHHGRIGITGDADEPDGVTFTDHRGRPLTPTAPPRPPGDPPIPAAHRLGIRPTRWDHPSGERLDTHWVQFTEPPPASPN